MTTTTKIDIWMHKKSHSVRLPVAVHSAFLDKAERGGLTIGQAAQEAQREHNGTLAEAITKWVGEVALYGNRELWCGALVEAMRPVFAERGFPLPEKIRASIAFTSTGWKGKARGECWSDHMSADGATEIMVHICETDTVRIANILTHELCHAAQFLAAKGNPKKAAKMKEKGGHGKDFRKIAEALDVTGDPLVAGSEKMPHALGDPKGAWGSWALPLIEAAGPCPHSAIGEFVKKEKEEKKQESRMLKLDHSEEQGGCGAVWRMSLTHIGDKPRLSCPCCGEHIENPHYEGEEMDDLDDIEGEEEAQARYDRHDYPERRGTAAKIGKAVKKAVEARQGRKPLHGDNAKVYGRKSVVQEMLDEAAANSAIGRHRRSD